MSCLCAESYQMSPFPGVSRHSAVCYGGHPELPHRGSPFPSVPMGLLGSRSCPFVLGAGERTSSLYSFKEWEGEGRKREPVSEWPPALPAPGL